MVGFFSVRVSFKRNFKLYERKKNVYYKPCLNMYFHFNFVVLLFNLVQ